MTDGREKLLLCSWEVQGQVNSNHPPHFRIDLEVTQNGQPNEMSTAQALVLWEYLLPRLKVRAVKNQPVPASDPASTPRQPAKTSNASPFIPSNETVAATGRLCPQTGWWESDEDPAKLQSAARVFIQGGEVMPHVIVRGEASVWDKLKGNKPSYRAATMWKFAGPGDTATQS